MCELIRGRNFTLHCNDGCRELTEAEKQVMREFFDERRKQFEADPPRGLRRTVDGAGWQCPNCGGAHGPQVATCPEPPKGGSLRERLKGNQ